MRSVKMAFHKPSHQSFFSFHVLPFLPGDWYFHEMSKKTIRQVSHRIKDESTVDLKKFSDQKSPVKNWWSINRFFNLEFLVMKINVYFCKNKRLFLRKCTSIFANINVYFYENERLFLQKWTSIFAKMNVYFCVINKKDEYKNRFSGHRLIDQTWLKFPKIEKNRFLRFWFNRWWLIVKKSTTLDERNRHYCEKCTVIGSQSHEIVHKIVHKNVEMRETISV